YHISPAVDVERRARRIAAARIDAQPQSQRMIFWEDALPYQRRSDRQRQQFGQLFDLVSRTCRQGTTADIDNRDGRLHQEISRPLNVRGIRRCSSSGASGVVL